MLINTVRMANGDVAADMVESALSGAVSGGTLSSGAYLVNGVVAENNRSTLNMMDIAAPDTSMAEAVAEESIVEEMSEEAGQEDATMEALERDALEAGDTVINDNYTQSADGVIHYKADQSVEARGWQGGDKFPGKDTYKNVTLEGSLEPIYLVKLKYSTSGYFMLKSEYDALKGEDGMVDSQLLSQGVQVAPWKRPQTEIYEYQGAVSIFKLEKDLDVALGEETLANPQYGIGKMTQIYIAGYDSENQNNNDAIGLKNVGEEQLKNSEITEDSFDRINDMNSQHIIKRDLFLQLAMKDELTKVKQQTYDTNIIDKCEEAIKRLDYGIEQSKEDLWDSKEELGGLLESSTYDGAIAYLDEKYTNEYFTENKEMENHIAEVKNDLLRQINENIYKDQDDRSIKITEPIMNVFEANRILGEVQWESNTEGLVIEEDRLVIDFEDEFKIEFPDESIDWGSISVDKPAKSNREFIR